jgi:uncharacterized protein YceH (UPF0502 family)
MMDRNRHTFPGNAMPLPVLDPVQIRVLGCLLEKQMSTPEYYPMTLNALVNACNQSSNRDPVMQLDEAAVSDALESLREEGLVWFVSGSGRVQKYDHRLRERFSLAEQEVAVLCELLLRGSQTPGELRSRTARLYAFTDLAEMEAALQCLAEAEDPIVVRLPRAPGSREARCAHLLGGSVEHDGPIMTPSRASDLQVLKDEVVGLKAELAELREAFTAFRRQFE